MPRVGRGDVGRNVGRAVGRATAAVVRRGLASGAPADEHEGQERRRQGASQPEVEHRRTLFQFHRERGRRLVEMSDDCGLNCTLHGHFRPRQIHAHGGSLETERRPSRLR